MQLVLSSRKTVFVERGIFFGIFLLLKKRNTPKWLVQCLFEMFFMAGAEGLEG